MNHTYIIAFWSLSDLPSGSICMDYFASALRKFGDFQCLNCRDRRDKRTMHLLRQADLVIVALRQSHREFRSFFCENTLRFSNCLYLVVDYLPDRELGLRRFAFEFRIPSPQLICIPYYPVCREIRRADSAYFHRELNRAQQMILRALGF